MVGQSKFFLLNGKPVAETRPLALQAGAVSLFYENGTLRYLRLGGVELIRQIYSAVRDQNWGTIPGHLTNVVTDIEAERFDIHFDSLHQQNEVDFRWQGHITGTSDGTVRFHMVGQAQSEFKYNRIGFCILHPMDCAGSACRIEHTDHTVTQSHFPQMIAPHQPFKAIRAIQHEYQPGHWVEIRMEGDTFEMEDQRNWIDASYKTYCTPLELPFPVLISPGTRIEQTITLRLLSAPGKVAYTEKPVLTLTPQTVSPAVHLPSIGLGSASHDTPLTAQEMERLARLKLAHIRVDVRPIRPDWRESLTRQCSEIARINTALELAVHLAVSGDEVTQLTEIAQTCRRFNLHVARWLIFREGAKTTDPASITLAKQTLGGDAVIIGGTDAFFTELNRDRPPHELMDGVVYSINPQVHAFDDASLVETLAVQGVTVDSARQFSGNKPIHVSPVTLKMRWNPNATTPQSPPTAAELPHEADSRQMSLFGAGWTLGSVKYLALAGAASLTFYETTGYMGVMATAQGSSLPDLFPDIPGGVYPMYHLFADLGSCAGGQLINLPSADILRVDGFGIRHGDRVRYLIANLTPDPQPISLQATGDFALRALDADTAHDAMRDPEKYRTSSPVSLQAAAGQLHMTLSPFAVITLDQRS